MSAEGHSVKYGAHSISFRVVRRNRKTLEIAVEPDTSVLVSAPMNAPMDAILAKVRRRGAWVRRQQRFFAQYLPRTPEHRYVAGETHLYLGRHYRLKVLRDISSSVEVSRGFITVRSHKPANRELTRALVEEWYRERALVKFAERLELNLLRFSDPEVFRPKGLIVRHLRQRWGSMSPSHRLLLNRRLIEAPLDSIDYVITHELCHVAEPHHGQAFFDLLDQVLPGWSKRKNRLERRMA